MTHDEIMEGKFTTLERINHMIALKRDIQRKMRKIETGELEEQPDEDEVHEKRRYKKTKDEDSSDSSYS